MKEQPPLCACHGEPMRRNGKVVKLVYGGRLGQQEWCCRVKRRERHQTLRRAA